MTCGVRSTRPGALLAFLAVAISFLPIPTYAAATGAADRDTEPIESTYGSPGRWQVERSTVVDGAGHSYVLHLPSNLGANGFKHPIVTWGNGSLVPESAYAAVLDHLASWGFVVVATTSTWTGKGDEILAAAEYLTEQAAQPTSVFYHRLATGRVGALGHSQGAYGALNAASRSQCPITTVVPINLPDPFWLSPEQAADLTGVRQPVFFVGASGDGLSTPGGLLSYLHRIPGSSVIGFRVGASHDTILGPSDGYLGYVTAWLMYRLEGDRFAARAFEGPHAEIRNNPGWLDPAALLDRLATSAF
jgi:hypothetical protein